MSDGELLVACVRADVGGDIITPLARDFDGLGVTYRQQLAVELQSHQAHVERLLAPFAGLTPREAAMLDGLVRGMTAEEIAREQYVAITTVRTHIANMLRKLSVRSQLGAVTLAVRVGWNAEEAA
jgi:DNA-binding NarL/FixJ family response regulator